MKHFTLVLALALTSLLFGCCSTPPVAVAPVGPGPVGSFNWVGHGQLEVFSAMTVQDEGADVLWYRHSDYELYDPVGNLVRHVDNTGGYFDEAPPRITLPAGRYVVLTQAKDYPSVKVPVVIEPGLVTRVHLDNAWTPPANAPKTAIVTAPEGQPVGWTAYQTRTILEVH